MQDLDSNAIKITGFAGSSFVIAGIVWVKVEENLSLKEVVSFRRFVGCCFKELRAG